MRTRLPVVSVCLLALAGLPACSGPAADRDSPRDGTETATVGAEGDGAPGTGASGSRGRAADREVEAVIRRLFDAMRDADSAAARALFHPDARLSGPVERDGEVLLRTSPVEPFLEAVAGADREWDERIAGLEIRVDGRLAAAWMDYVFRLGGEFSHCGVNAVQLYRSEEGWKIFQIADTRRTEECPELPPERG